MKPLSHRAPKSPVSATSAPAQDSSSSKASNYFAPVEHNLALSTKQQLWEKAVNSKTISSIKAALKQGLAPKDLTASITIKDSSGKTIDMPLVAILLAENNNDLGNDQVYFEVADNLIKQGARLPEAYKKRDDFSSTVKYFHYLSQNSRDLYLTLRSDPAIIKEQDPHYGLTLAHTAAMIGLNMNNNQANLIHDLLFKSPNLDLNLKDKMGNTPVHLAALHCNDQVTCRSTFPRYIKYAIQSGFDFSTLGQNGETILHILVRTNFKHSFDRLNSITNLLRKVPHIINILSKSGSTALFSAVNHLHFETVHYLLDAGANPKLYAGPERDPVGLIDKYIEEFDNLITAYCEPDLRYELQLEDIEEHVNDERIAILQLQIERLEQLKHKIASSTPLANN